MQTKSKITLGSLIEHSNIAPSLIRATVRQFGGWQSFTESAPDICRGGIDGGFHGFIYCSDTHRFAKRNRAAIAEMASLQAGDFGTSLFEMIRGFGCFRSGPKPTDAEIGAALYGGYGFEEDSVDVRNALAWYAGEEVARAYCDLTDQN